MVIGGGTRGAASAEGLTLPINLHLQICKLTSTRWLESSTCIALQSAPKVGVVIKVGMAQQNIL